MKFPPLRPHLLALVTLFRPKQKPRTEIACVVSTLTSARSSWRIPSELDSQFLLAAKGIAFANVVLLLHLHRAFVFKTQV